METLDTKDLWENVLNQVELSISGANFNTWFRDSALIKIDDHIAYVGVPSQFFKDWYKKKFHNLLLKTFRGISTDIRNVEYMVVRDERRRNARKKQAKINVSNDSLPLDEYYINKSDNLNPRYLFDNFVVGSFNELAHAAAKAVIEKPGIVYNPLYIYGEAGIGKTHLIQAVGNQFKKLYPNRKVYYMATEKFIHEYQSSVAAGTANRFKSKYRNYDLLIMDDMQFIAGKEKTQEEMLHLFNYMHDNNKQIVFSSDKNPNFIPDLADRLKTRFSMGMMINISEPDTDSRMMILRKKAAINGIMLPEEVIDYIASNAHGSIRELEGVLNSIICQKQLKDKVPGLNEVKQIVKNVTKPQKTVSVKSVVEKISNFFNIEPSSVYEKNRKREVVRPRQISMYILREDFGYSYPAIGDKLGGRDHTTVIHSYEKIKTDLENDPTLAEDIAQIRSMLE